MRMNWMVGAASACLMVPALASAQYRQAPRQPARAAVADTGATAKKDTGATARKDTGRAARDTTTSAGEVAPAANVPPQALSEQKDAKLIGSPAWWETHATADGKPKSGR